MSRLLQAEVDRYHAMLDRELPGMEDDGTVDAYENGVRDALQSIVLAFRDTDDMEEAVQTVLDAYSNNL